MSAPCLGFRLFASVLLAVALSASPAWATGSAVSGQGLAEPPSARLERIQARLLTVTIQAPESPALVLTEDPRISVISSRGPKPSITVSQQFLSVLTDDELTFALAHEMAHFALLHHGLLQSQGRGLSAFRDSPQPLSADQRRQLHHDMEFQADALAMEWMRALGLPSQASVETLKKAYGKAAGSSPTHPSLQQRAQRLTELFN